MKLKDKFIRLFSGKKMIILGDNKVGKTTLHTFLRENRFIKNYEITSDLVNLPPSSYRNGSTKFHMKKGIDISGDKIYTKYWQSLIKDSSFSIFIFNTYKAFNNESQEISYISEQLPIAAKIAQENNRKLFVFGNFTDKIYNFDINRLDIKNKIRPILANSLDDADIKFDSVQFGSMDTQENLRESLNRIYSEISKQRKENLIKKIPFATIIVLILILIYIIVYYNI